MARIRGKDFAQHFDKRRARRFGRGRLGPQTSLDVAAADRPAEIAELAEAVADEHCPALPIDPQAIARAKGITVSFGDYGDAFDGMLEWRADRFHIYANTDRVGNASSPRARFTLAHELGHYFIDEHRTALVAGRVEPHLSQCDYESPILAEQEADRFAASLLMPAARFLAKAKAATPGLPGVIRLADQFASSLTAAAIRFAALDVAPCAVVKWNWRGYAWKHLSSSAFRASFRRTFESPADLAEDSPTRRALAHESPGEAGYFEAGTTAAAWFPAIGDDDARNAIFIEQAIPLGRFGVLTFLRPQRALPTSADER
ncbi:MAG: ImmA/IrrE family metallo-endopeptidase [Planctomycetota bacterium]|jgi:Zn-dependent peptidase ImmA (M78 family)